MEFGPILRTMRLNKVRYGLIAAEIALTLAIVVNCINLIRDARREMAIDSGFDDENLDLGAKHAVREGLRGGRLLRQLRPAGSRRDPFRSRSRRRFEHALPPLAGGRKLDGDAARRHQGGDAPQPGLQRGRVHARGSRGAADRGTQLHARRGRRGGASRSGRCSTPSVRGTAAASRWRRSARTSSSARRSRSSSSRTERPSASGSRTPTATST